MTIDFIVLADDLTVILLSPLLKGKSLRECGRAPRTSPANRRNEPMT